jgi:hypothetical protein
VQICTNRAKADDDVNWRSIKVLLIEPGRIEAQKQCKGAGGPHRSRANCGGRLQALASPEGWRGKGHPAQRWINRHRERTQKGKGVISLCETSQF